MKALTAAFLILTIFSPPLIAAEVQLGRYSMKQAVAEPAQRDLLAVIIDTHLPRQLLTVGDALGYLLRRSGYQLLTSPPADPVLENLLALALPAVHRHLGPLSLRDALVAIAGPAYELHDEPVHRRVYFTVREAYRQAASPATVPLTPPGQTVDSLEIPAQDVNKPAPVAPAEIQPDEEDPQVQGSNREGGHGPHVGAGPGSLPVVLAGYRQPRRVLA